LRRREALLTLGAALLVRRAWGDTRTSRFRSPSLGRDVAVTVQLPPSYAVGNRRYPVLYALHGLFESHDFWAARGLADILASAWQEGDVPELIVVSVDGGNSFFLDSRQGAYQDVITRDAVSWAESVWRVTPGRGGRALLGVSMGGYAALRIALTVPDVFGAVASHSAMLLRKPPTAAEGASAWHLRAFHAAFGDPIDGALWAASDPLELALRADRERTPALRFDCGAQDRYGLAAGHQELHRRLETRGVAHEFTLAPGDHGYEFVREALPASLRFLGRHLIG